MLGTQHMLKRCMDILCFQSVLLVLFVTPIVLLFTLFAEPRVRKAGAERLEGNSRSCRNCRHVYSLLAGTAAIAAATT